jgi:hypothetical protein
MNGTNKQKITNPELEEFLAQIQTLAKIKYKIQCNRSSKPSSKGKGSNSEAFKIIEEYCLNPPKFKEDITKW